MNEEKALLYYNSANAYYQGATILMKPPDAIGSHLNMAQPAVTCADLALKLYLKCILTLEDNDSDDPMPLTGLYKRLKEETRKKLLGRFDDLSNATMNAAELTKHLEALDAAFARWRYIHEHDAKNVNLEDLEELILATKSMITESNPGWC